MTLKELEEFKSRYMTKEGLLKSEYVKAFKMLETSGLYEFLRIFLLSMQNRYKDEGMPLLIKDINKLSNEQITNISIVSSAKCACAKEILNFLQGWVNDANALIEREEKEKKKGGEKHAREEKKV